MPCWIFCSFTLVLSKVSLQCPVWLFSVLPWFCAFPVCCWGTVWMISRLLYLYILLLLSLCLLSTCTIFLLSGLQILGFFFFVFLFFFFFFFLFFILLFLLFLLYLCHNGVVGFQREWGHWQSISSLLC